MADQLPSSDGPQQAEEEEDYEEEDEEEEEDDEEEDGEGSDAGGAGGNAVYRYMLPLLISCSLAVPPRLPLLAPLPPPSRTSILMQCAYVQFSL